MCLRYTFIVHVQDDISVLFNLFVMMVPMYFTINEQCQISVNSDELAIKTTHVVR